MTGESQASTGPGLQQQLHKLEPHTPPPVQPTLWMGWDHTPCMVSGLLWWSYPGWDGRQVYLSALWVPGWLLSQLVASSSSFSLWIQFFVWGLPRLEEGKNKALFGLSPLGVC